jgi:hypothetical protein
LFAVDGQEPLFAGAELDMLHALADQATEKDRAAASELTLWARS